MNFDDQSIYDEKDLERHFSMSRVLFEQIYRNLDGRGIFIHRTDSVGSCSIHPRMSIIAALRVLASGMRFPRLMKSVDFLKVPYHSV